MRLVADSFPRQLTIEELVLQATELLCVVAPKQTRYKVNERPDVRTIRYYTSQGLLPKAVSYEGGRARYGRSHLIRLVAIKKMQVEHYTLGHIKKVLAGKTDDELLGMLEPNPVEHDALEPTIEKTPAIRSMARFELGADGSVDVDQDALGDPSRRRDLIESLQSLARMLGRRGE